MVKVISLDRLYELHSKVGEMTAEMRNATENLNKIASDYYKEHIHANFNDHGKSMEKGIVSAVLLDISKKSDDLYYRLEYIMKNLNMLIDDLVVQEEKDQSVSELTLRNYISLDKS